MNDAPALKKANVGIAVAGATGELPPIWLPANAERACQALYHSHSALVVPDGPEAACLSCCEHAE